ncbi:hypothetical protein DQW77_05490 [Roseovarius sp. TE539]|uniref:DUF6473 family protein n=1 Tax=Roseovarius sp. TE539 TaxID=2249812 RepID=UPI000DE0C28B|nr:DUF6473 family protein [Roseovarius sp. TE539]RBI75812.1 hypothetical protein DQW77_05490 [Roseovarius sp. TE539]
MTYEKMGETTLDYMPCRYGDCRLLFRGPKRTLNGGFAAFLGGTETYGKYISRPFPALVEARTGLSCVNFGWPNAGVDVFLNEPDLLRMAGAARVVVLQVPCAQNLANRYYAVHPRRNDRFVEARTDLRGLFPEVDFTEFHFTRHMLSRLRRISYRRYMTLRQELQAVWLERMHELLGRIDPPVVLLWFSAHPPGRAADRPDLEADPALVTDGMINALRGQVLQVLDVTVSADALAQGTEGMIFSQLEVQAAGGVMNPAAHEEAAEALTPLMAEIAG